MCERKTLAHLVGVLAGAAAKSTEGVESRLKADTPAGRRVGDDGNKSGETVNSP